MTRLLPLTLLLAVALAACTRPAASPPPAAQAPASPAPDVTLTPQQSGTGALLVGVSAVNERVVWAGGAAGTVLRTTDGGQTWQPRPVPGADSLQFRDVHAVSAQTAYALSIGEGATSRIYKTSDGGASWTLQFQNEDPQAFFDCMAFWNARSGLAFSDAVDGQFVILTTADGGQSWQRVPPERLPPAVPGEGSFAAGGTCVAAHGDSTAWIGTGNAGRARVLRTTDRGRTWQSFGAPLDAGEAAGIASLVFRDARHPSGPLHGLAFGGDIGHPSRTDSSAARTTDGGKTWQRAEAPPLDGPVYGAAYVPGTRSVIAVGPGGVAFSADEGASWRRADTRAHWGVAFACPQAGWVVGPEGRITRVAVSFE